MAQATRLSRLKRGMQAHGGRAAPSRRPSELVAAKPEASRGAKLAARFLNDRGLVVVEDVAEWFGMTKGQLASTVGVKPEALRRVKRVGAPKTQTRIKEMLEIVGRVADWAGGKDQAMAWYRAEPLPAFGGRTAESLVKDGKAAAVRDYLDHVALGGFA
jgi:uncharacterized protein (DUF2384 family)